MICQIIMVKNKSNLLKINGSSLNMKIGLSAIPLKKQSSIVYRPYVSFSPRLSRDPLSPSGHLNFLPFPPYSLFIHFSFTLLFISDIIEQKVEQNPGDSLIQANLGLRIPSSCPFHFLLFLLKIWFLAGYDHSSICFAPFPASDQSLTNMVFFSSENFAFCFICSNSCSIIHCSSCFKIRRFPPLIL